MKIGLLGTGFGMAHAQIYRRHPHVEDVVFFGRTSAKLDKIAGELGFATTTDLDRIYDDPNIDLVDVCLPTALHADHVIRALQASKHVLCELPLASSLVDAQRVVDAHGASDRQVFVDMFVRFDPVSQFWHKAITEQPYGALKTLQVDTRTALLWEGYNLGLDSIAMDVMHASLDTIVTALGRPKSTIAVGVSNDTGGQPRRSSLPTRARSCTAAPRRSCPSPTASAAAGARLSPTTVPATSTYLRSTPTPP